MGMIFFHLLEDVYDMSWIDTSAGLSNAPIIAVLMLAIGLYFGAWAGLFLMVSAMGNMLSMYNSLERGTSVGSVIKKQVVGGIILLFFAFLAEGTLQYYAVFQTLLYPPVDWTRILWKGYTMETIHTIAWCMIVNGIIQGVLSINGGHKKIKRNMIIYGFLAVITLVATQPLWDWVATLIPGYPFQSYNYPQFNRNIAKPSIGATWDEYVIKFFLMPIASVPEPIFPFLAVSFLGSILGLALCKMPVSRKMPKQTIYIGLLVVVAGLIIWIIGDMPFDSLFPMSNFSSFRSIGGGINWKWLPWVCFITGGQLCLIAIILRLIEFRGKSEKVAKKTKWLRVYGLVPFTLYTYHRIIAMLPLYILSLIFQKNMLIDSESLNGYASIAVVFVCLGVMYVLLRLWEKVDFIGGLEWMIGTIGAYALGVPKKSKEKLPWYRYGARDNQSMLNKAEWINIFEETDNGGDEYRNSKLAWKFAMAGFFVFPATFISMGIHRTAIKLEGENKYTHRAHVIGIMALIVNITLIILFTVLTMGATGLAELL